MSKITCINFSRQPRYPRSIHQLLHNFIWDLTRRTFSKILIQYLCEFLSSDKGRVNSKKGKLYLLLYHMETCISTFIWIGAVVNTGGMQKNYMDKLARGKLK